MMESNSFIFLHCYQTVVTQRHWIRIILGSPLCLFGSLIMSWTQLRDVCSSLCAHLPKKKKKKKCKYLLLEPQQIFWKRYRDADSKNEFFFSGEKSRFCYCLVESKDQVYGDIGRWNRQNIMSSTLLQIEYKSLFLWCFSFTANLFTYRIGTIEISFSLARGLPCKASYSSL